jgi:isoleucyl-tRNA synthetase
MEAMVRWLAPILSFTADEIWQYIPGERGETVFVETWYAGLFPLNLDARFDREFWGRVIAIRTAVGKQLEQLRASGVIGSSLDAELDLYCDEQARADLDKLEDELRFVLITSYARVHGLEERPAEAVATDLPGVHLRARASAHGKCGRCWHHREDVGSHAAHPTLCGRCVENVDGAGEARRIA